MVTFMLTYIRLIYMIPTINNYIFNLAKLVVGYHILQVNLSYREK